jgi:2-C-methyl-D-erythritol 4-phosphate cytidylyltransferase
VSGGATRGHSVAAAVALVPPSVEIVVVHDAAHPLADAAQASAVVASLRADEAAVAAVPALAVHESLVHASTDGVAAAIAATRGSLQVQMPHAFRADTLRQMVATPSGASDEVAALVLQGERVRLVPGSPNNVHVTSPAELAMAALLLRHRPTDKE